MKTTIRCIVLVSACSLWSACEEPKPAPREVAPASSAQLAAPKLIQPGEALSALAPEKLKTIADPTPSVPAQELTEAGSKPSEPKGEAKKSEADETASKEKASGDNFDRPLSAAEVKVERFVLASDVKEREPIGESDTFSSDTKKIFAFVQLANADAPYAFRVHWEPVDGPSVPYGVKLTVPTAERFRTWSWTAIERKPGRYRAVLRTLDGEEIASRELLITPAEE